MKFLKRLRDRYNLNSTEMAKKIGIRPQSYFYLEEKAVGTNFTLLKKIRATFNISWEQLGALIDKEF